MQKKEDIESIYVKILELSDKHKQITLNILKENGLANEMVLEILFEELDTITLQEAISVTPESNRRQKIWRRRKKSSCSERFIPNTLLEKESQYYLILKRRDEYISKQEVMNRLDISKPTLYRVMNSEGMKRGPYISIEDYKKIKAYLAKTNKVSIKEVMIKMNMRKTRTYEIAKAAGVSLVSGFITQAEFKKIRKKYEELTIKSALNSMMNRGIIPLDLNIDM